MKHVHILTAAAIVALAASSAFASAFAQAPTNGLEYGYPEYGCAMQLPLEDSVKTLCDSLEQSSCGKTLQCEWLAGERDAGGTLEPGMCNPRRGTYIASPSTSPNDFPLFTVAKLFDPREERAEQQAALAANRAQMSGANKKYSEAISIYSKMLESVSAHSTYQSRFRTWRGLAYEYKGDKEKALADYCMSVAFATDFQSEEIARTRILQLVDKGAERTAIPQFAKNGIVKSTIRRPVLSKIKIIAPDGDDFLIKLVNAANKNETLFIYVRADSIFESKIPPGSYKIQGASGIVWYGVNDLFGNNTEYFRMFPKGEPSNDVYDFNRHGRKINWWTFTLRTN